MIARFYWQFAGRCTSYVSTYKHDFVFEIGVWPSFPPFSCLCILCDCMMSPEEGSKVHSKEKLLQAPKMFCFPTLSHAKSAWHLWDESTAIFFTYFRMHEITWKCCVAVSLKMLQKEQYLTAKVCVFETFTETWLRF